jgi:hypothetical protein
MYTCVYVCVCVCVRARACGRTYVRTVCQTEQVHACGSACVWQCMCVATFHTRPHACTLAYTIAY